MNLIKKIAMSLTILTPLCLLSPLAIAELPNDEKLVMGKLDNGMKYLIYPHANPKGQINLWLQIHSGSLVEDDDQQGIAHFVEHMLFNGTRDYPENQVIENFEKMGLKFGRDVNAYTTYHETVYQVNMANDNIGNIHNVMNIFYNWASLATFDPAEVDAERGVIVEEWRSNQGLKWRNNQQRRPLLLAGSRYLDREPIGLMDIVNNVSAQRVQDYYKKWYQPDNMTFIIVGDLGDLQPVDLVKKTFSGLSSTSPVQKESFKTKANDHAEFVVISDDENISNSFAIIYRQPRIFVRTEDDFTLNAQQSLLTQLFNQRLYDMLQQGQLETITSARSISTGIADDYQAFHFRAQAKDDNLEDAITTLLNELQRIDNFGFTQEELTRLKKTQLAYFENAANNPDSRDAKMLAARVAYSQYYDLPLLSPMDRYQFLKKAYDKISLEQVNHEWKLLRNNPDVIYEQLVNAEVNKTAYSPQQILAFVEQAKGADLTAYQQSYKDKPLMVNKPKAGNILAQSQLTNTITELQLDNGAKVVIRPTDNNDSNVYFTAISNKGFLNFDEQEFNAAKFASKVVNLSGLGDLSEPELKDWTAANFANINTMVQAKNTFISISGNNKKLEPMFQLMHQRFHAGKVSNEIWKVVKQAQENEIKALAIRPKSQFNQQVYEMRFDDKRTAPITMEELATITPDYLLKLDQRLFADPSDFTFLIIGNVDIDDIANLAKQYLASLTVNQDRVLPKSVDLVRNKNPQDIILNLETEPFSQVIQYWNHPLKEGDATEQMRQELAAFNFAIARDLRIQIRENESGAYSVGSVAQVSPVTNEFDYRLTFSCDPTRADDLLIKANSVVLARIEKGITESELEEYKKMQLRMIEVQKSNNSQLSRLLLNSYVLYDAPIVYSDSENIIQNLTVEAINQTAKQQFEQDNFKFKAILLPKL